MYFRSVIRKNPATDEIDGYYRLVESYRNENNRICHQTLLTVGFIDFEVEKLNDIQRILNDRVKRKASLFKEKDPIVIAKADQYWNELVKKGKVDVSNQSYQKKKRMIDAHTMQHKDVREIGSEWMCYQAVEQLKIRELLKRKGWEESKIQLAIT